MGALSKEHLISRFKPERKGRSGKQMSNLHATAQVAVDQVLEMRDMLEKIDCELLSHSNIGLGWNPLIQNLPMSCTLRQQSRGQSIQSTMKMLHVGNFETLMPAMYKLNEGLNAGDEFYNQLVSVIDKPANTVLANAHKATMECWNSIVEPVWDAGGYMDFAEDKFRITGRSWEIINFDRLNWMVGAGVAERNRNRIARYRIQAAVLYGEFFDFLMTPKISASIDNGHSITDALASHLNIKRTTLKTMCTDTNLNGKLVNESSGTAPLSGSTTASHVKTMSGMAVVLHAWKVPENQWPNTRESWDAMKDYGWSHPTPFIETGYLFNRTDIFKGLLRPDYAAVVRGEECRDALHFFKSEFVDRTSVRLSHLRVFQTLVGCRKPNGVADRLSKLHSRLHVLNAHKRKLKGGQTTWKGLCDEWTDSETGLVFVPITDSVELAEEGMVMHHCVGGYDGQCIRGASYIFGVRLMRERIATLEICDRNAEYSYTIRGERKQRGNSASPRDELFMRLYINQLRETYNRNAQSTVGEACNRFLNGIHQRKIANFLNKPSKIETTAPVMKDEQIAETLFSMAAGIVMPEWKDRTWKNWVEEVRWRKGD